MRLNPSLLQRLSRGNMPNEAYNILENATLEQPISEMNNMMQLSMTSYRTSATNLRGGKDQYPRTLSMLILTAPMSQISDKKRQVLESQMPWFSHEEARCTGNKDCEESQDSHPLCSRLQSHQAVDQNIQDCPPWFPKFRMGQHHPRPSSQP